MTRARSGYDILMEEHILRRNRGLPSRHPDTIPDPREEAREEARLNADAPKRKAGSEYDSSTDSRGDDHDA